MKYGEDTTFLTKMILKKRKYGALYYANYFYRKRFDNSSAVQGQPQSPDWYFVSPKRFLEGTIRKWPLELIGDSAAPQFQSLKVFKKRASWSKLPDHSITTLLGPIQEYATFHITLPLGDSDTHYINAVLKFRKVYAYKLRLTFGRFSPISHELPAVTYRFLGSISWSWPLPI